MNVANPNLSGSARVCALYDYWRGKCGDRGMPSRADIEPGEIKSLLPHLMLTDLSYPPLRVFFRLVGTAIVEAAHCDLTGRWLHEVDLGETKKAWEGVYQRVAVARVPVFGVTRAVLQHADTRAFHWVVLPLSGDGETVDHTLELEDWEMLRLISEEDVATARWTLEVRD